MAFSQMRASSVPAIVSDALLAAIGRAHLQTQINERAYDRDGGDRLARVENLF
jgi:hypothetical protein